jgi:hypothetical protein
MQTIKNVTQLIVAKDQTQKAGLEATYINALTDLNDGDVVVTDAKNLVFNAASMPTVVPSFKLIQRSGSKLIHSDIVFQGKVVDYNLTKQDGEDQQVDYVGSNGTTGSLDELASNIYTIRLYIQGSTITDFMQQKIKEGFYKSNTAAASYTQAAVAAGLVKSLVANYSREPEQDIVFDVINSGTRVALGTGAGTVTFTNGSKAAVFGTDIDDATTNAALAVGDLLAINTTKTTGVYTVTAINSTTDTATLDRPFEGATATVANATVGRVVAATAAAADYGVKIAGVDRYYQAGFFASAVTQWKTTVDFGDNQTTTVDESVAAWPGIGTSQQVGTLEKELQSDNSVYRAFPESGVVDDVNVVQGSLYDVTVINFGDNIETGLGMDVNSPKTLQIALENNTAQADDTNTGIITTLNAIIVAKWGTPGAVNQVPTA